MWFIFSLVNPRLTHVVIRVLYLNGMNSNPHFIVYSFINIEKLLIFSDHTLTTINENRNNSHFLIMTVQMINVLYVAIYLLSTF